MGSNFILSKRTQAVIHDLAAVVLCWFVAYWLRFNLDLPETYLTSACQALILVLCFHAPTYWLFGLYRGIWRYASLMDLRRIILAVGVSAMLVSVAVFMLSLPSIPRSVLVLHPVLLIMAMGGSRFAYRAWKDRAQYGRMMLEGQPVLVLGTGDAAERLLRELVHSPDWSVVGLLSPDAFRVGHELRGIKILGLIKDLPQWVEKLPVRNAIVAMPETSQAQRRHAMELAVQAGLSVLTVPSL
ncbi:MAG: polysaccharide biosynthesis protein, partial [Betaproteobacteria bacterium]